MTTPDDFRRLALALPETEEAPHFESASFRVRGKIVATLDGLSATLKLPVLVQEALIQSDPDRVSLPIHWSRFGWTTVELAGFEEDRLADLLDLAWRQVAPKALVQARAPRSEP
jgi:hypothetical protein